MTITIYVKGPGGNLIQKRAQVGPATPLVDSREVTPTPPLIEQRLIAPLPAIIPPPLTNLALTPLERAKNKILAIFPPDRGITHLDPQLGTSEIAVIEAKRDKINQCAMAPPKYGFNIATTASLDQAKRLLEIWFNATLQIEEYSLPIEKVKEDFFEGLKGELNISSEEYNDDGLVLEELIGQLAKLGVVTASEIAVVGNFNSSGEMVYMYLYLANFVWAIKRQEEMAVKTLDGKTTLAKVYFVYPFLGEDYGSGGFSKHKEIFINEVSVTRDDLQSFKFYRKQYFREKSFIGSPDILQFLQDIPTGDSNKTISEYTREALHYSNYRLISHVSCSEEQFLRDCLRNDISHERQHNDDKENQALTEIIRRDKLFDPIAGIYSEFRPRINELQASPRARLISMIDVLLKRGWSKVTNIDKHKYKYLRAIFSEYLMLQAIIEIIKQNPGEFGCIVRPHPKFSDEVQICGQLHKLTEGQRPALLIQRMRPYLEDEDSLISLFNPDEPYFKERLESRLP